MSHSAPSKFYKCLLDSERVLADAGREFASQKQSVSILRDELRAAEQQIERLRKTNDRLQRELSEAGAGVDRRSLDAIDVARRQLADADAGSCRRALRQGTRAASVR